MSIRKYLGYWTVFEHGRPVRSYGTFMEAWSALYAFYAGFVRYIR
jgi:hypothetical protein